MDKLSSIISFVATLLFASWCFGILLITLFLLFEAAAYGCIEHIQLGQILYRIFFGISGIGIVFFILIILVKECLD